MFELLSEETLPEQQARKLASTLERNAEVIQKSSEEIREVFEDVGCTFSAKKFISVSSSMFAMLIVDNIRKGEHYEKEEALSAFLEEVDEYYLAYADLEVSFDADVSERDRLKREAARWAAEKYFQEDPTREQVNLFYERAEKFVDFLEEADLQSFARSSFF